MKGTAVRIIPCLDVRGGRVVKGVKFENLVDSGDPAELSRRYEEEGADEIAMLDISATIEERATAARTVERVRQAISIPLLVGGGIRTVEDASILLKAGADRVSVNSAAVSDPVLITRLADLFGVQCVVVAVDAKRRSGVQASGDLRPEGRIQEGRALESRILADRGVGLVALWEIYIHSARRGTGKDAVAWCAEAAALGAGEILLTSIDRDGTGLGYDLELLAAVSSRCGVSVIASGGAATPEHFMQGIEAGAGALLAAGVFHRQELPMGVLKEYLADRKVEVRR